jgi:hypothetical protein
MPFPRPCLLRTGALGKARRCKLRIEQDHVLRCRRCRGPMLPNSGAGSLGGASDWRSRPFPLEAHRAAAVYFGLTWPERAGSHHHSTSLQTRGSRLLAPSARGLLQVLITKSPLGGRQQTGRRQGDGDTGTHAARPSLRRRLLLRKPWVMPKHETSQPPHTPPHTTTRPRPLALVIWQWAAAAPSFCPVACQALDLLRPFSQHTLQARRVAVAGPARGPGTSPQSAVLCPTRFDVWPCPRPMPAPRNSHWLDAVCCCLREPAAFREAD